MVEKRAGHRHLQLGILAERHPDGVAYTLREQSAYAHGRFDTPVLAVAGFGHTDVKRIAQALALHGF